MTLNGYLIVKRGSTNWKSSARFVKSAPGLTANEIAIRVECNLPDELFTRPQLKFKIDVPKEAIPQKEITAEVIGNVQDLIQSNLGIEVKLICETQQVPETIEEKFS